MASRIVLIQASKIEDDLLKELRVKKGNLTLYNAGLPFFPRNFTRDSIISAMLMGDSKMLRDQLIFCAEKQGQKKDPYTGEEPGKIFHECPGVEIRGLSTLYNACDTTALFIIGHKTYYDLTKSKNLAIKQEGNIIEAANYIKNHLKDGLFIEDPKFCGGDKFALKVTYWKDSEIISREKGEPEYPVAYFLAHVQNMHAIKCAATLLGKKSLLEVYSEMRGAMKRFFSPQTGLPFIAIDKKGPIEAGSSDFLFSLAYLEKGDLSQKQIDDIATSSRGLETKMGYLPLDKKASKGTKNSYHTKSIWPFEQAIIHMGAEKFGIERVKEVSMRIRKYLKTAPEIVSEEEDVGCCDPQLWTIAAKKYFSKLRKRVK